METSPVSQVKQCPWLLGNGGALCPPDVYVEALDPTPRDGPAFGDAVFTEVMVGERGHGGGGGWCPDPIELLPD